MLKEKVPMKIVVPIIVVTWVLSLITAWAIVFVAPSLFPVRSEQLGEGAVTSDKIADSAVTSGKIAGGVVTNAKLASGAIPYSSANSSKVDSTDSTEYVDMDDMSVNITLARRSYLLIMFSAVAYDTSGEHRISVQALVNETLAAPGPVYLTPIISNMTGHTHYHGYAPSTFNFVQLSDPGTYTIKMQWKVTGASGCVRGRSLIVIALPAQ